MRRWGGTSQYAGAKAKVRGKKRPNGHSATGRRDTRTGARITATGAAIKRIRPQRPKAGPKAADGRESPIKKDLPKQTPRSESHGTLQRGKPTRITCKTDKRETRTKRGGTKDRGRQVERFSRNICIFGQKLLIRG